MTYITRIVDGSYDPKDGITTWGIADKDGKKLQGGLLSTDSYKQATGELHAALVAINEAIATKSDILLKFDFNGIFDACTMKNIEMPIAISIQNIIKKQIKEIAWLNNGKKTTIAINKTGITLYLMKIISANNTAHDICKTIHKEGGTMHTIPKMDMVSDYAPYLTESGEYIYIHNANSLLKYINVPYLFAYNAPAALVGNTERIAISTRVIVERKYIARLMEIFGTAPILGSYAKKLATSGKKIVTDFVGGTYEEEGHDGGGLIGYDFCEKHGIPLNKLTQMFIIKPTGLGFAKGAFMPSANVSGVHFGPGTIKAGYFVPGEEIIINVYQSVGRHNYNESFETAMWYESTEPWITHYNEIVLPRISAMTVPGILDYQGILEEHDVDTYSRALALLRILGKDGEHHAYIREQVTEKVMHMLGKYITSGGRIAKAYPLVADNSIPEGCICVCDGRVEPGKVVTAFRYPVLQGNGCREMINVQNNGPRGEWIKANPKNVKNDFLGDFDIDTLVIMTHRPGKKITGFDKLVIEFPTVEQHFSIDELTNKIALKGENLIGKACIDLAAVVTEIKDPKAAKLVASFMQASVDSLKKKIQMPKVVEKYAEWLKETPAGKIMPKWWMAKLATRSIDKYYASVKNPIKFGDTEMDKLVKTVYDSIGEIIGNLPAQHANVEFVGIWGAGVPMTDKELAAVNAFRNRIHAIATKISDKIARREAIKFLSIEVDNFAKQVGTQKCIWYWNYYHTNAKDGKGTVAVWLITSVMSEQANFHLTNMMKFNCNRTEIDPEAGNVATIDYVNLTMTTEGRTYTIYKDQIKFVSGHVVRIVKVVPISKTSISVYVVPQHDGLFPPVYPKDKTVKYAIINYGDIKTYVVRHGVKMIAGIHRGTDTLAYIQNKFKKMHPYITSEWTASDEVYTIATKVLDAAAEAGNFFSEWKKDFNEYNRMGEFDKLSSLGQMVFKTAVLGRNPDELYIYLDHMITPKQDEAITKLFL